MKTAPFSIVINAKVADAVGRIKRFGAAVNSAIRDLKKTAQTAKEAGSGIRHVGESSKRASKDIESFKLHLNGLEKMLKDTLAAFVAFKGRQIFRDMIDNTNEFRSAILGLSAIAEHKGIDVGQALQEASKLAQDGLMDVASAAKALQNLLQRGFTLGESVKIIQRLKDAAAFNRAAHLSLAEAVVTATEGLKNENSVLVDNAGVTKNVSQMWKEYAKELGKGVNSLTLAEKRQAELKGILQETAPMLGNAAKLTKEYQGQVAKFEQEIKTFQATLGETFLPVLKELVRAGGWALNNFIKPIIWYVGRIGAAFGAAVFEIQQFGRWIKSGFKGGLNRLKKIYHEAHRIYEEVSAEWFKELNTDPFQKAVEGMKKLTKEQRELKRLTAQLTQAQRTLKQLEYERTQAVKKEQKEEAQSIKETIHLLEQKKIILERSLNEALRLQKQYADEVKRQEQAIVDIEQSTQDMIREIRRRSMTEEELEQSKRREFQEKLAKANTAYFAGQLDLADKFAREAQRIASSFKEQQEAIQGVSEAGDLLNQIHEEMKWKAEENLEAQKEKTKELQRQIAELDVQLKQYQDRLTRLNKQLDSLAQKRTVTQIDADIEKAKAKIAEIKEKLNSIKDKTVTITVREAHEEAHRFGGLVGLSRGGKLPGYGGGDKIRALLEPGEFVIKKEAVAKYGVSLLNNINNLRFNLPSLPKISLPEFRSPDVNKTTLYRRFEIKIGEASLKGLAPEEMLDTFEKMLRRRRLCGA